MVYGYCRCSTSEDKQDINRQIRELVNTGVPRGNIFAEYESGTKENRLQLQELLDAVKDGDTITSTEVSRITRSTKQLCEIIQFAKDKKIKLILGTFVVDCTNDLDPMTERHVKDDGSFCRIRKEYHFTKS